MREMEDLLKEYPINLHVKKESILREYLQHEILRIIFTSKYAHRLVFLGGTCVRLIYHSERFSEDLDFDNKDLSKAEFEEVAHIVKRQMELLGYKITLKFAYKGAFHCSVKFPGLLYDYNLTGHKEAVLFIKLDAENQQFDYTPRLVALDRFGINEEVLAVPADLLASQKIAAIMGRKRAKGRDFYDLHFLLQKTTPNYAYLDKRFQVHDAEALRILINEKTIDFDFKKLALNVRSFLFDPDSDTFVQNFPAFWQQANL
jgi:predicted nucleotidyltransferase component of viral defense system